MDYDTHKKIGLLPKEMRELVRDQFETQVSIELELAQWADVLQVLSDVINSRKDDELRLDQLKELKVIHGLIDSELYSFSHKLGKHKATPTDAQDTPWEHT